MHNSSIRRIKTHQVFLAFLVSLGLILAGNYLHHHIQMDETAHHDEEVHVHSDFLIIVNDQKIDLSDDLYQSSTENKLHEHFHLHDNDDHVLHRHATGLSLPEFFNSLGFTLTDNCFITDRKASFCTNNDDVLRLYVNGVARSDITGYVPAEADQILIYYGDPTNPALSGYLAEVTNEACVYSGTCPERGLPPPESCGLTCEI